MCSLGAQLCGILAWTPQASGWQWRQQQHGGSGHGVPEIFFLGSVLALGGPAYQIKHFSFFTSKERVVCPLSIWCVLFRGESTFCPLSYQLEKGGYGISQPKWVSFEQFVIKCSTVLSVR